MPDNSRTYCAQVAVDQSEPLLGTAPQVDVWLLLEYRPTWEAKALQDNELPAPVNVWLDELLQRYAAQGSKARPQFIRQRRSRDQHITFFIARNGALQRYDVASHAELCALDPDQTPGVEVTQQHYFVCSNGRRDLCCSRFGLPVYARLRNAVGERAWETSHVGGHRYAANLVTLPQGALYGHLSVDAVDEFVEQVEQNQLSLRYLRGRSAYPAVAQVAETQLEDVERLVSSDETSATFLTPTGEKTIQVTRSAEPITVIPSCGAEPEAIYPLRPA